MSFNDWKSTHRRAPRPLADISIAELSSVHNSTILQLRAAGYRTLGDIEQATNLTLISIVGLTDFAVHAIRNEIARLTPEPKGAA